MQSITGDALQSESEQVLVRVRDERDHAQHGADDGEAGGWRFMVEEVCTEIG